MISSKGRVWKEKSGGPRSKPERTPLLRVWVKERDSEMLHSQRQEHCGATESELQSVTRRCFTILKGDKMFSKITFAA